MHHHLLIASRQLWPNILGLLMLKNEKRAPGHIHILHTEHEIQSKHPAIRLKKLIEEHLLPGCSVTLNIINEHSPQCVNSIVNKLRTAHQNGETQWSINATGGLKTLFAGICSQVFEPDTQVFYSEINGDWFQLLPGGSRETLGIKTSRLPSEHPPLADSIPVQALIECQFHSEGLSQWSGEALNHLSSDDILEIIQLGVSTNWNWKEITNKQPSLINKTQAQAGFAFEALFAALVNHFINLPEQGMINATLKNETTTQEELDLVINSKNRIVVYDLKLTNNKSASMSSPAVDQIAKVAEAQRRLGGLGGIGVLVRPNWSHHDAPLDLAKQFNVKIWCQEDMQNIISLISQTLQCDIPQSLEQIDGELRKAGRNKKRIFSSSRYIPSEAKSKTSSSDGERFQGWLTLTPYIHETSKSGTPTVLEINTSWLVLIISHVHYFDILNKNETSIKPRIEKKWKCSMHGIMKSNNGQTAVLLLKSKDAHECIISQINKLPHRGKPAQRHQTKTTNPPKQSTKNSLADIYMRRS